MIDEFAPYQEFQGLARLWWLMVLAAIIGGLFGFTFSRFNAPIYEAVATFFVSVDLTKIPKPPLTMHDEDMALETTKAIMISPPTLEYVLAQAKEMGLVLDANALLRDTSIERRHAFWELRYRSTDAVLAQKLVNLWAEKTYEQIQIWQKDGRVASYLIYSPPTLASLPDQAVRYDVNRLVFAGSLFGWIVGILICGAISRSRRMAV